MDYGGESGFPGSNVGQIMPEMPGNSAENWIPGMSDQAMWATEDDYGPWNGDASIDTTSNSNYEVRPSQSRSGSEPPNKRSRNSHGDFQGTGYNRDRDLYSGTRAKAIGRMFFKTKLCCKFRAGTCPYITNCNFAHGIEELRKPPPNWQEIVAAQDEDHGQSMEPREEHQIPTLSSSTLVGETQRSYKGRHCKKFYTEEGCPYGAMCTFLHDEQSKARESVAISLGPTVGSGGYGNGGGASNQKPSNWKTRICNKWETTGYCPFGSKCHFAHGLGELHRYGGGLVEMEGRESSSAPADSKPVGASKMPTDTMVAANMSVPHTDVYHMGVPSQRATGVSQRQGQRSLQKWKGPDKISRIYGDWIDDNELEQAR